MLVIGKYTQNKLILALNSSSTAEVNPNSSVEKVKMLKSVGTIRLEHPTLAIMAAIPREVKKFWISNRLSPAAAELINENASVHLDHTTPADIIACLKVNQVSFYFHKNQNVSNLIQAILSNPRITTVKVSLSWDEEKLDEELKALSPLLEKAGMNVVFKDVRGIQKKKLRLLKQTQPAANVVCKLTEYVSSEERIEREYEAEVAELTKKLAEEKTDSAVLRTELNAMSQLNSLAVRANAVADPILPLINEYLSENEDLVLIQEQAQPIMDQSRELELQLALQEEVEINARLRAELEENAATMDADKMRIMEQNQAIERARAGNQQVNIEIQRMNKALEEQQIALTQLTAEVRVLTAEKVALSVQTSELNTANSTLSTQVNELKAANAALSTQANELKAALEAEKSKFASQQARFDEHRQTSSASLSALNQQVQTLQTEKDEVTARTQELSSLLSFEKAKTSDLQASLASAELAFREAAKTVDEHNKAKLEEHKQNAELLANALRNHQHLAQVQAEQAAKRIQELEAALLQSQEHLAENGLHRLQHTPSPQAAPVEAPVAMDVPPADRRRKSASPTSAANQAKRARTTPSPTAVVEPQPAPSSTPAIEPSPATQGMFSPRIRTRIVVTSASVLASLSDLASNSPPTAP